MILKIRRIARRAGYTIGRLYINGSYFCDVLEDTDRGLRSDMPLKELLAKKIKGRTAIPTGIYDVILSYSPKFAGRRWAAKYNGNLPLIAGIPGYSRVFLHVGNTASDTDGCPLLGLNKAVGKVLQSTVTFQAFMDNHLMPAFYKKDKVRIIVE